MIRIVIWLILNIVTMVLFGSNMIFLVSFVVLPLFYKDVIEKSIETYNETKSFKELIKVYTNYGLTRVSGAIIFENTFGFTLFNGILEDLVDGNGINYAFVMFFSIMAFILIVSACKNLYRVNNRDVIR